MKKTLLLSLFILIIFGCRENNEPKPQEPKFSAEFISKMSPGEMRIKIDDKLSKILEAATDKEGVITKVSVKSTDDILSAIGATYMTRTFPYAGEFEERTRMEGLHLWYDVYFDANTPLTRAHNDLSKIDGVSITEFVPKMILYNSSFEPIEVSPNDMPYQSDITVFNDPLLKNQWHYYNAGGSGSFLFGSDINVIPAWENYTTGDPNVIVSVVDGGIDINHEDLIANLYINEKEYNGEQGIDDDGNGYVDDIYGYNFVNNGPTITPDNHGTHVGGTIAAVNNNGKGVCGIAGGDAAKGKKGVRIMSCQIFQDKKSGSGARAIKYGADNGAVISQNSWGYDDLTYTPESDKAAIDYFVKYAGLDKFGKQVGPMKGGLVVFAAGNDDSEILGSPAHYESAMAVASIGPDFTRAYYSNYGDWIDITATGGDYKKGGQILSTLPDNKYGYMQGTSMACPHVSGVAALVVSRLGGPGFTPDILWNKLTSTTKDIYQYNNPFVGKMGSGLLNAHRAVGSSGTIAPLPVTDLIATVVSNIIKLKWSVTYDEDDNQALGFTVYYSKTSFTSDVDRKNLPSHIKTASFETGNAKVGDKLEGIISGLEFATPYYLAIDASDVSNNKSALSTPIQITTNINTPPVITALDGADVVVKAHQNLNLRFSYSDEDGHSMTYAFVAGSKAAGLTKMADYLVITISGQGDLPGNYTASLKVSDEFGASTTQIIKYKILPNTTPVVIKAPNNIVLDGVGKVSIIDLSKIFNDADGEQLEYTVSASSVGVAHANPSVNELYITSTAFGITEFTVVATDALKASCQTKFKVLVRDQSREIDIYPNPVIDKVNVRLGFESSATITIFNSLGAKVFNQDMNISPFEPASIDMSAMNSGVYSVVVKTDNKEIKRNIVKL